MSGDLQARLAAIRDQSEAATASITESLAKSEAVTAGLVELIDDLASIAIPPIEPPIIAKGYVPGEMPAAVRTLVADSLDELNTKLASAEPGDRIELRGGSYGGFTASCDGTEERPIAIVGNEDVTITGKVAMPGNWVGLYGSKLTGDGRKIDISGTGGRVSRCRFPGVSYDGIVYLIGDSHPNAMVDFNTFTNISGAAVRSEIKNSLKHQNMYIGYNLVDGHTPSGGNESVMLVLTDAYNDAELIYEYNLFKNCLKNNTTGQGELISVKTAKVILRGNTLINCNRGFLSLRETRRCLIEDNWFRNGSYIKVHGDDHTIRNNDSDGLCVEMNAGNATFDTPLPDQCQNFDKAGRTPIIYKGGSCKTAHTATRGAKVSNNKGGIKLGVNYPDNSYKCVNIELENNAQAAQRVANSFENVTETGVGNNNTTAFELDPAWVGCNGTGLPARM